MSKHKSLTKNNNETVFAKAFGWRIGDDELKLFGFVFVDRRAEAELECRVDSANVRTGTRPTSVVPGL